MMNDWNSGIMEYWNGGKMEEKECYELKDKTRCELRVTDSVNKEQKEQGARIKDKG
jgi:hypothetical protein